MVWIFLHNIKEYVWGGKGGEEMLVSPLYDINDGGDGGHYWFSSSSKAVFEVKKDNRFRGMDWSEVKMVDNVTTSVEQ